MTTTSSQNVITPGTILEGDFGYSMVMPVFYEVIDLTPSGKSAKIRRLATTNVSDDGYGQAGYCKPVMGVYCSYDNEVLTKRIKKSSYWGECLTVSQHTLHIWDGKEKHFDYYD